MICVKDPCITLGCCDDLSLSGSEETWFKVHESRKELLDLLLKTVLAPYPHSNVTFLL